MLVFKCLYLPTNPFPYNSKTKTRTREHAHTRTHTHTHAHAYTINRKTKQPEKAESFDPLAGGVERERETSGKETSGPKQQPQTDQDRGPQPLNTGRKERESKGRSRNNSKEPSMYPESPCPKV